MCVIMRTNHNLGTYETLYLFHCVRTEFFASNLWMSRFCWSWFLALHSFQYFKPHIGSWPSEVLATIYKPLESANEQNNAKGDHAVV
jgi:hypothetical protein